MIDRIQRRKVINRRAFLYGAGTIAIGLPFLEGLPERSAWAAGSQPIFTFFFTPDTCTLSSFLSVPLNTRMKLSFCTNGSIRVR